MNDMSDIVFKTTEDQQNFEKAKKLLKRTLKLFHADGGIGIAQDQHQKILSYEGSSPVSAVGYKPYAA